MANRLELPDDLNSLVEKRDQEDRRQEERRTETAEDLGDDERRSGADRREQERRDA